MTAAAVTPQPIATARRFVLIDRDGTLNIERHYISDPDLVELYPGAGAALRKLNGLGFGLVVVTNQSGVAKGLITPAQLEAVHARLGDLLAAEGVVLDGIYVCPHGPDEDCPCRKPRPGLITKASAELGFDPARAFLVGDKGIDIDLGRNVGAQTILVRTGYGAETEQKRLSAPDHVADNLEDAADWIAARAGLAA